MRCIHWTAFLVVLWIGGLRSAATEAADALRVATFQSDITPPLGQPMISGDALRTIEQPLLAKGIVLEDGHDRYVLCASTGASSATRPMICRSRIAAAAGTEIGRVAVQCVHQHTAPPVDADAQRLLPPGDPQPRTSTSTSSRP